MFAQLTGWCSNFTVWFRDSTAFVRPSVAACNFFAFLFLHFKISCFCSSCSFKLFVIASNWSYYFLQVAAGVWVHNVICSWSYIPGGIMYNFWHFETFYTSVLYLILLSTSSGTGAVIFMRFLSRITVVPVPQTTGIIPGTWLLNLQWEKCKCRWAKCGLWSNSRNKKLKDLKFHNGFIYSYVNI